MTGKDPAVDAFIERAGRWREEFRKLRAVILDCGLTEELKWGQPCYTFENANVVLMHGFKEYCALLFFKGALLKDPGGILIRQTENVQSARQIRFTAVEQITGMETILKEYILEAVGVEKAGLKVELKQTADFTMPEELRDRLDADAELKAAFEGLTPGRQRAYMFYCSAPKQAKTRESRVLKCVPQILRGKGLHD